VGFQKKYFLFIVSLALSSSWSGELQLENVQTCLKGQGLEIIKENLKQLINKTSSDKSCLENFKRIQTFLQKESSTESLSLERPYTICGKTYIPSELIKKNISPKACSLILSNMVNSQKRYPTIQKEIVSRSKKKVRSSSTGPSNVSLVSPKKASQPQEKTKSENSLKKSLRTNSQANTKRKAGAQATKESPSNKLITEPNATSLTNNPTRNSQPDNIILAQKPGANSQVQATAEVYPPTSNFRQPPYALPRSKKSKQVKLGDPKLGNNQEQENFGDPKLGNNQEQEQEKLGDPKLGRNQEQEKWGDPKLGRNQEQEKWGDPKLGRNQEQEKWGDPKLGRNQEQEKFGDPKLGRNQEQEKFGDPKLGRNQEHEKLGDPKLGNIQKEKNPVLENSKRQDLRRNWLEKKNKKFLGDDEFLAGEVVYCRKVPGSKFQHSGWYSFDKLNAEGSIVQKTFPESNFSELKESDDFNCQSILKKVSNRLSQISQLSENDKNLPFKPDTKAIASLNKYIAALPFTKKNIEKKTYKDHFWLFGKEHIFTKNNEVLATKIDHSYPGALPNLKSPTIQQTEIKRRKENLGKLPVNCRDIRQFALYEPERDQYGIDTPLFAQLNQQKDPTQCSNILLHEWLRKHGHSISEGQLYNLSNYLQSSYFFGEPDNNKLSECSEAPLGEEFVENTAALFNIPTQFCEIEKGRIRKEIDDFHTQDRLAYYDSATNVVKYTGKIIQKAVNEFKKTHPNLDLKKLSGNKRMIKENIFKSIISKLKSKRIHLNSNENNLNAFHLEEINGQLSFYFAPSNVRYKKKNHKFNLGFKYNLTNDEMSGKSYILFNDISRIRNEFAKKKKIASFVSEINNKDQEVLDLLKEYSNLENSCRLQK
jgi:hypothetical protein